MDARRVWIFELHRLFKIGQREEILPGFAQHHATAEIGVGEFLIEKQRAGEILGGPRGLLQALERQAAIVQRHGPQFGRHGIDAQRRGVIGNRQIVLVEMLVSEAAVEQRIGQNLRLQLPRLNGGGIR